MSNDNQFKDESKAFVLALTCSSGNLEEVKQLVKNGYPVHTAFDSGNIINYSPEIVNYLELARKMKELEI